MKRILEVCVVLSITFVFGNSSPKFGERIKKDDKNASLIEVVFRPQQIAQATAPKPIQEPPVVQNVKNKQNVKNDNKIEDKVKQNIANERHIEYKFSTLQESDENNNNNNNNEFNSDEPNLERRSGYGSDDNQHESNSNEHHFSAPDFDSFDFGFSRVPDVSSSDHNDGAPVAPPAPQPPQQSRFGYQSYQHQEPSYDHERHEPTYYESEQNHRINPEFSFDVPQGFPLQQDPRADVKKETMGAENNNGKPWGTKTSYTYRDPKNPNNFMEMSEVKMTVNREMNPQEAQSQIQKFLTAAQSGQYGPIRPVHIQASQSQHYERHPNHNYDSGESHFTPNEPPEPNEPKFPNF